MAEKPDPVPFPPTPPNLTIGAELNKGAWGVVYNGDLGGRTVAVKRIHDLLQQSAGEQERRKLFGDFREECKKLQKLNHPHVVGFIGAFSDPRLGPILVMEKMQENLREFLQKWEKKLQVLKQLRISLEIVRGVAFLHQQTPPLVHRDLNDKNVMFSFEGVIKIGDFGQSKLKKGMYLTTANPGMVTFMPPEALKPGQCKYTESLDIFSVGVLLMEIGTQQEPQGNVHGIGTIPEIERREGDLKVLGKDHPLRPLVVLCLSNNPMERPKASDLQREVLAMVDGNNKELEERVWQLEAELIATKKDQEQQLAEIRDECDKARRKAIAEAEIDKNHLIEETEHLRRTNESLHLLLCEKDDTIQQLEENLRGLKLKSPFELKKDKVHIQEQHMLGTDVAVASNDATIRELRERCEQLEAQASIYKLDFELERSDREEAMRRFEEEKEKVRLLQSQNAVATPCLQQPVERATHKRDHQHFLQEGERPRSASRPEISTPKNFVHISHLAPDDLT